MDTIVSVASAVGGGGLTLVGQWLTAWLKARGEDKRAERSIDVKVEEHRDELTFRLLDAAHASVVALQKQVEEQMPSMLAAAHLREALDHLHELLHAEGDAERLAAERRAKAFLRRMRPAIGDLRNAAQAAESARHVFGTVETNHAD